MRKDRITARVQAAWDKVSSLPDCDFTPSEAHQFADAMELGREEQPGRFADWTTRDMIAQCRAQARSNLDPEYSSFMEAVADRLAPHPEPAREEGE